MKKNSTKLAIISIAFNFIFILGFLALRFYNNSKAKADTQKNYELQSDINNTNKVGLQKEMDIDSTDIVFIGNSLTEGFPVTELFRSLNVKNRGIGWNQTKHLLARLPDVLKSHPRKVFIEIGINDITISNKSAAETFDQYKRILDTAKIISPRTEIVVQLLMPTAMKFAAQIVSVKDLNQRLIIYCKEKQITLVDTYSPFLKNGQLDSTLTYDGVHLNNKGYHIWKDQVTQLVVK